MTINLSVCGDEKLILLVLSNKRKTSTNIYINKSNRNGRFIAVLSVRLSCNKRNRKKSYPDKIEAKLLYTHVLENVFFIETFITCLILIVFSLFPGKNDKAMHAFSPNSDWVVQEKNGFTYYLYLCSKIGLGLLSTYYPVVFSYSVQLARIDYEMVSFVAPAAD